MGGAELPGEVGSWLWRGLPPGIDGLPLSGVPAQGWTVADLTTPVATLSHTALSHNQRTLDRWAGERGALLAPHVKTTMSPELLRLQLDAGVWAVTAANPWQAAVMAASGAPRVMIANEVADARDLARVLADAEVWVFVDSPGAVAVVAEAGRLARTEVPVVLEVGFPGGRAGVRTLAAASRTAQACLAPRAAGTPGVRLAGYGLFEGILATGRTPTDLAKVGTALERAVDLVEGVAARYPVPDPVVTGGGSMFPDLVADALGGLARSLAGRLVLRPGCYLVHDHGSYAHAQRDAPWLDLRPALTVRTTVLSVPEPGLALLDAGKRDFALDGRDAPILELTRGGESVPWPGTAAVRRSNDQHSYLEWTPAGTDAVLVGDVVRLGVSHPCLTLQLWRALPVLDDDGVVVSVARTFF